jgi:plastocyanin
MNTYLSSFARRMRLFWGFLSLATVAALLVVGCGGAGTTTAPTPTATSQPTPTPTPTSVMVKIVEKNGMYSFDPATVTVKAGTQVVWTNTSDAPHTVTSDTAGVFGSPGNITQNQTFMFTFTTAGTFPYHCNVHPYMKATITVTS